MSYGGTSHITCQFAKCNSVKEGAQRGHLLQPDQLLNLSVTPVPLHTPILTFLKLSLLKLIFSFGDFFFFQTSPLLLF